MSYIEKIRTIDNRQAAKISRSSVALNITLSGGIFNNKNSRGKNLIIVNSPRQISEKVKSATH